MSLNEEEITRTRAELHANFRLSGATSEEIRTDLDLTAEQFDATSDITDRSRPQDVWLLRDHLENLVRARGETPVPFTVLTERARLAAALWFPLRRPPKV